MPAEREKRQCADCGCTEERACVIQVVVASANGTSKALIARGCSWSRDNPKICSACDAVQDATDETEILMDLFPVEFGRESILREIGR
jgi:hypothetical protein